MNVFDIARAAHIAAGGTALAVLLLPLLSKKGGTLHRRSGWVYVVAMGVVALTGAVMCVGWLTDDKPANDAYGLFLFYIALLSAASASLGVRVLRTKKRTAAHRNLYDLGLPALLLAGGLALGAYGLSVGAPLFVSFAALGSFLAITQLRFWLRPPATKREWFFQHIGGMGGSCITAITAFVVVNAPRLGLGSFNVVLWVAPGVLGGIGILLWQRHYRLRGERGAPLARRPPVTT